MDTLSFTVNRITHRGWRAEGEALELARLTFVRRSEKHCADGGSMESRTGGQAGGACVEPKGVHPWVGFPLGDFRPGGRDLPSRQFRGYQASFWPVFLTGRAP